MATLLRRVLNVQLLMTLANTYNLSVTEYCRKINVFRNAHRDLTIY